MYFPNKLYMYTLTTINNFLCQFHYHKIEFYLTFLLRIPHVNDRPYFQFKNYYVHK